MPETRLRNTTFETQITSPGVLNHRRTSNFLPGGAVIHLPKKFLQVAQIFTNDKGVVIATK